MIGKIENVADADVSYDNKSDSDIESDDDRSSDSSSTRKTSNSFVTATSQCSAYDSTFEHLEDMEDDDNDLAKTTIDLESTPLPMVLVNKFEESDRSPTVVSPLCDLSILSGGSEAETTKDMSLNTLESNTAKKVMNSSLVLLEPDVNTVATRDVIRSYFNKLVTESDGRVGKISISSEYSVPSSKMQKHIAVQSSNDGPGYCFLVHWDSTIITWNSFRTKIIGSTSPALCPDGTLRKFIHDNYANLVLEKEPNPQSLFLHVSSSPLEALSERCLWFSKELEDDEYGKMLLGRGIPKSMILDWCNNNQVPIKSENNNKMIKSSSVFDVVADMDTEECTNTLVDLCDSIMFGNNDMMKCGTTCNCIIS